MRKVLIACVVVGLVVSMAMPGFAKTKWNANSVWPPNNHQSAALVEFAEKVKQKTNGELEIVVQSGGALGYKGPELLKAVRDGLVPISDMLTSGVAGDEPLFAIPTLPFLTRSHAEAKTLAEVSRPYFDKAAEKWKQRILFISPWPAAGLWTKTEIKSVAEMKGLKTRTYDKNGALVMEATGGTPYALPFSEVYSSLATGLIDSVLTSTPTAVDAKFWEVLKFYQPINITQATDLITVNLAAFNKLDPQMQQILVDTGKEMEAVMWEKVAQLDQQKSDECVKNGMTIVPVSDAFLAELSDITKKIREDWLASAPEDAKAIYAEFLKAVGR